MAFSAKASEARPHPHDPSGIMLGRAVPGTRIDVGAMLNGTLVGVNESAPGEQSCPEGGGDATDLSSAHDN